MGAHLGINGQRMGKGQTLTGTRQQKRYAVGMTSLNASSTYGPLRGAALVSGTFWKRWGVSSAGTLEAETVRGPLIIWAKPAAKEEAPKLGDPQPTPLEGRVIGLNTAAHFARFFFAARRRVRHSIRWKTGRKHRNERANAAVREVHRVAGSAAGQAGVLKVQFLRGNCIRFSFPRKTAKERRDALQEWKITELEMNLPNSTAVIQEKRDSYFVYGYDREYLEILKSNCHASWQPGTDPICLDIWKERKRDMLVYALITGQRQALRAIMRAMKQEARRAVLAFTMALRHLEAAAYLAHVRRRVKPASRRARSMPDRAHLLRPWPPL